MSVNPKTLATAIIIIVITVSVAALASGMTWLSILVGVAAWGLAFKGWLNPFVLGEKLRRETAKRAFESLDVVALGRRWRGDQAEVARVREITDVRDPAPWELEVLARTDAKAWFVVEMRVKGVDRVAITKLHHIDEETAKRLLGLDPETYERFFGEAETA